MLKKIILSSFRLCVISLLSSGNVACARLTSTATVDKPFIIPPPPALLTTISLDAKVEMKALEMASVSQTIADYCSNNPTDLALSQYLKPADCLPGIVPAAQMQAQDQNYYAAVMRGVIEAEFEPKEKWKAAENYCNAIYVKLVTYHQLDRRPALCFSLGEWAERIRTKLSLSTPQF